MLVNHRKKIIAVLAILVAISTLYYFFIYSSFKGVVNTEASYVGYDDAASLVNSAELIVIATPVKDFDDREHIVTTYKTGAVEDFYTKTELKVEKVLKGSLDEKTLTVIEPISYYQNFDGKRKMTTDGYSEMLKDNQYIVALAKNYHGEYGVINMTNGVFNLSTQSNKELSSPNEVKSSDTDLHEQIKKDLINLYKL